MPELDASTAQQLFQTLDPYEQQEAAHLMHRMRGRDAVAHILAQRQAYDLGVTSHEAANLAKKPSAGQSLASEALGVADAVSGGAAEGYGALADAPDGLQIPAALLAASPAGLPAAVILSALGLGKTPKIPGVGDDVDPTGNAVAAKSDQLAGPYSAGHLIGDVANAAGGLKGPLEGLAKEGLPAAGRSLAKDVASKARALPGIVSKGADALEHGPAGKVLAKLRDVLKGAPGSSTTTSDAMGGGHDDPGWMPRPDAPTSGPGALPPPTQFEHVADFGAGDLVDEAPWHPPMDDTAVDLTPEMIKRPALENLKAATADVPQKPGPFAMIADPPDVDAAAARIAAREAAANGERPPLPFAEWAARPQATDPTAGLPPEEVDRLWPKITPEPDINVRPIPAPWMRDAPSAESVSASTGNDRPGLQRLRQATADQPPKVGTSPAPSAEASSVEAPDRDLAMEARQRAKSAPGAQRADKIEQAHIAARTSAGYRKLALEADDNGGEIAGMTADEWRGLAAQQDAKARSLIGGAADAGDIPLPEPSSRPSLDSLRAASAPSTEATSTAEMPNEQMGRLRNDSARDGAGPWSDSIDAGGDPVFDEQGNEQLNPNVRAGWRGAAARFKAAIEGGPTGDVSGMMDEDVNANLGLGGRTKGGLQGSSAYFPKRNADLGAQMANPDLAPPTQDAAANLRATSRTVDPNAAPTDASAQFSALLEQVRALPPEEQAAHLAEIAKVNPLFAQAMTAMLRAK